jgi:hypothetical protein
MCCTYTQCCPTTKAPHTTHIQRTLNCGTPTYFTGMVEVLQLHATHIPPTSHAEGSTTQKRPYPFAFPNSFLSTPSTASAASQRQHHTRPHHFPPSPSLASLHQGDEHREGNDAAGADSYRASAAAATAAAAAKAHQGHILHHRLPHSATHRYLARSNRFYPASPAAVAEAVWEKGESHSSQELRDGVFLHSKPSDLFDQHAYTTPMAPQKMPTPRHFKCDTNGGNAASLADQGSTVASLLTAVYKLACLQSGVNMAPALQTLLFGTPHTHSHSCHASDYHASLAHHTHTATHTTHSHSCRASDQARAASGCSSPLHSPSFDHTGQGLNDPEKSRSDGEGWPVLRDALLAVVCQLDDHRCGKNDRWGRAGKASRV